MTCAVTERVDEDPVGAFQDNLNAICGSFDLVPGHRHFAGKASLLPGKHISFAHVAHNGCRITRAEKNIRQDPGDHFFLIVQQTGSATISHDGQEIDLNPGDMTLVDSTKPSNFYYNKHSSDQLSVHLPRRETLHRFGQRVRYARGITSADPLGSAMRSILNGMVSGPNDPDMHLVESFHSVFGSLLLNRSLGDQGPKSQSDLIYNRALDVMAQHFRDTELSVPVVADRLGVSTRVLQRAFQKRGERANVRLNRLRVEAAQKLIEKNDDAQHCTVSSIAYSCGFNELSTFYRQYKTHFGAPPRA